MRNRDFQPMRHSKCPANESQPQSSQWETATDELIRKSHHCPANEKEGNFSQLDTVNVPPMRNIHSSVQLLSPTNSLRPHRLQCIRPPCPSQLPEPTQTHVHWVGDSIQPSHPLSSPSPPTFNLSQHQGLFLGVGSSHQVTKVLEFQLQHQSFQWIFRSDFL